MNPVRDVSVLNYHEVLKFYELGLFTNNNQGAQINNLLSLTG